MKKIIIGLAIIATGCQSAPEKQQSATTEPVAREKSEKTFEDGEFEMKQYFFVMLTKGKNRDAITDSARISQLQMDHLANIDRLYEEGHILVAGPFGDDGNWRGLLIFDSPDKESVEKLIQTDPMVAAGWLGYEIHPWWTAKNEVFR